MLSFCVGPTHYYINFLRSIPLSTLINHALTNILKQTGGGKKVTRVEVTLDGGETWSVCELDHQEKPNKYGKFWCWCFWSLDVEVLDLLSAKDVAVRAWDESFNTQPDKLIWNLMVISLLICFIILL